MNAPIEQEEYRGLTINIYPDDDPMNPREDSNLGHMVCFHRRYSLGDKHEWRDPQDFQAWANEQDGKIFLLPLYLYDHSGITMNTIGFSCPWDSGQVGYIYTTREEVLKEFGGRRVTKRLRDKVESILKNEVASYDVFISGACVGFSVVDKEGEDIDSCWGFDDIAYAISEAKSGIDYRAKVAQ